MSMSTNISKAEIVLIDQTGEYEARLARLWERNLGGAVGREEDYFQKGGDSLRAAQLLAWIQEGFGIELSLLDLFESRTIADQARLVYLRLYSQRRSPDKPTADYRYLGPARGCLFSVLHQPGQNPSGKAVVMCYPIGQEYMRIHRTYVELARSMAIAGHYALRFDYHGCGDSAGESVSGDLDRWVADIRQAVAELRCQTGIREIYLVGARIGANLGLRAAAGQEDFAGIVLWEPIVNGTEYLATLQRAHSSLLAHNAELDGYELRDKPDCFVELSGFPVTKRLYDQIAAIDLLATPRGTLMSDTLVVANSEKQNLKDYVSSQNNGSDRIAYTVVGESDGIWLKEDRQNYGLVPARAVQAIVSWVSGRAA
jgi:uncharacterized protein